MKGPSHGGHFADSNRVVAAERRLAASAGWRHSRCENREKEVKVIALLVTASTVLAGPVLADSSYPTARPNISCLGRVVWVNTRSHVYHYQGETWFGHIKGARGR